MSISVTNAAQYLRTGVLQDATLVVPDRGVGALISVTTVTSRLQRLVKVVQDASRDAQILEGKRRLHAEQERRHRLYNEKYGVGAAKKKGGSGGAGPAFGAAAAGEAGSGEGGEGGGISGEELAGGFGIFEAVKHFGKLGKTLMRRAPIIGIGLSGASMAYDISKTGKVSLLDAATAGMSGGAIFGAPGAVVGAALGIGAAVVFNSRDEISRKWGSMKDLVVSKTNQIKQLATEKWDAVVKAWDVNTERVSDSIHKGWTELTDDVASMKTKVETWLSNQGLTIENWFDLIVHKLRDCISTIDLKRMAENWLHNLSRWVRGKFGLSDGEVGNGGGSGGDGGATSAGSEVGKLLGDNGVRAPESIRRRSTGGLRTDGGIGGNSGGVGGNDTSAPPPAPPQRGNTQTGAPIVDGKQAPTSVGDVGGLARNMPSKQTGGGTTQFKSTSVPYDAKAITQEMGITPAQWSAFEEGVTDIEGKNYGIMGGAGKKFAGRYQMGPQEIDLTAKRLGVPRPSNEEFLKNPELQEKFFENYTLDHYRSIMKNPKFAALPKERQLELLGYAHNQGVGGSDDGNPNNRGKGLWGYLDKGQAGHDAWGTSGTAYFAPIRKRLSQIDNSNRQTEAILEPQSPTVGTNIKRGAQSLAEEDIETLKGLRADNPQGRERLKKWMGDNGVQVDPANLAWCASLVNAALQKEGVKGAYTSEGEAQGTNFAGNPKWAPNFAKWGHEVTPKDVQKGDVVLFNNLHHVGMYTGKTRQGKNGLEYEMIAGNEKMPNEPAPPPNREQWGGVGTSWVSASSVQFRRSNQPEQDAQPSIEPQVSVSNRSDAIGDTSKLSGSYSKWMASQSEIKIHEDHPVTPTTIAEANGEDVPKKEKEAAPERSAEDVHHDAMKKSWMLNIPRTAPDPALAVRLLSDNH
jgi:hypothetical protein